MSTATTEKLFSPEDLLTMPDGDRYELIDGRLKEHDMSTDLRPTRAPLAVNIIAAVRPAGKEPWLARLTHVIQHRRRGRLVRQPLWNLLEDGDAVVGTDLIEQPGQTLRMVVAIDLRHVVGRPVLGRAHRLARELDQGGAIDRDRLADLLLRRVQGDSDIVTGQRDQRCRQLVDEEIRLLAPLLFK